MDPSKLSERLRAMVRPSGANGPGVSDKGHPDAERQPAGRGASPEQALVGEWRQRDGLSCFVVERRQHPDALYGRQPVKTIAARLAGSSAEAACVMGRAPAQPFLFFDLETTGLSGGAGTYAFLVGCGAFDDDGGFVTRQFVLLRHADERQLLQTIGAEFTRAGALVSFNGKSFDAPLIETRHLYHRLEWTAGALPHFDVLHPARRFWGDGGDSPCSLAALERSVLGAARVGDVPGAEIPERYFQFLRTGDAGPLAAVLEHNRLDLLSLAGLAARLLELVQIGPGAARHPREALALGRVYAQSGQTDRAGDAYESAISGGRSTTPIKIEALRSLGYLCRRVRRHHEAAGHWRRLIDIPGCPPHVIREATEALAIHHEHRARDLPAARAFALRSLTAVTAATNAASCARDQAVRHRLARIERKLQGGSAGNRPGGDASGRPSLFPS
jgi:uncharacterized protein YprB with RNaseH-like and TPR domain